MRSLYVVGFVLCVVSRLMFDLRGGCVCVCVV